MEDFQTIQDQLDTGITEGNLDLSTYGELLNYDTDQLLNPVNEDESLVIDELRAKSGLSITMVIIIVVVVVIIVILILLLVISHLKKKNNKIDTLSNMTVETMNTVNTYEPQKLPDDYSDGDFEYDLKGKLDFNKPT